MAEADDAVSEMVALRGLEKGLVKVGSVASALASLLPEAIDKLVAPWPGLQVRTEKG